MTEKTCNACRVALLLEPFTQRTHKCKLCTKAYDRARYERGEESTQTSRNRRYLYKYGITEAKRDAMVVEQDHKCAICLEPLSTTNPQLVAGDHCHSTKKVRGILCRPCNVSLGLMKEDTDRLHRAIQYLQKNRG